MRVCHLNPKLVTSSTNSHPILKREKNVTFEGTQNHVGFHNGEYKKTAMM